MDSKIMILGGIAIGVAAVAAAVIFATQNQQANIPDTAVLAPAAEQGSYSSSGLGATINKEQWHDDPFADIAAKVRENAGK